MPETNEQKTPEQVREEEAARVRRSEEDGVRAKAYNPTFMPGYRPDVQITDSDTMKQTVGDEEVEVAVRAGATAIISHPDQHMAPTAGVSGGTASVGGASTTSGASAGSGGSGAGTGGGTTAGGAPIETGQGSTRTSRAGESGGTS